MLACPQLTSRLKQSTHRELAGGGEIDPRMWPGGGEQRRELAGGDEHEAEDDEPPVPMADPSELVPDPAVVLEHDGDVGEPAELPREANHAQHLQVADDPEEHADHEEDGGAVDPGGDVDRAGRGVPPGRAEGRGGPVPVCLVRGVGEGAGDEEAGEDAKGAVELRGVPDAHLVGVVAEAVDAEEAAEAGPAEQRGEGEVGEGRGQGERDLHLPVEGTRGRGVREREGDRGRRRDGEEEEDCAGGSGARSGGVVDAHPAEAGPEAAELVPRVRRAAGVLGRRRRLLPRQQRRRRRRRVRHGDHGSVAPPPLPRVVLSGAREGAGRRGWLGSSRGQETSAGAGVG